MHKLAMSHMVTFGDDQLLGSQFLTMFVEYPLLNQGINREQKTAKVDFFSPIQALQISLDKPKSDTLILQHPNIHQST